jgi:HD-GYP domain-containing protein (c-di-GMP phosphodiesterase class II)
MSQTILIEPNEDLRKIYSLNLNTFAGTDVIVRQNAEDAIQLLRILPTISLIVCKNKMGEEETANKIVSFLKEEMLDIPIMVMGDNPTIADRALCLPEPVVWEKLVQQAAKFLGVTPEDLIRRVKPDFVAMSLAYFYDITQTPCDIYLRIKKGPGDFQFVKRIHSKDTFDFAGIKKYEEQGLKEFYIQRDYQQYFTTFVTNSLVRKLERTDLSMEDRILTTAHSYDVVADQVQKIGMDQATVELADAGINSMISSVKDSPQLAGLLKFLFTSKVSLAYQHCHLIAVMCQYILSKQSWYQPKHLEVLSFVSFFSDITLKTNEQISISSDDDLRRSNLEDDERQAVLTHARDAATLLERHPGANEYIKTVLLQHHGKLDGVGFNESPGEDLHPLSKVFIIADGFVKILLRPDMPSSKREILPLLYDQYTSPSYQKIIKALEQKFQA